jgi:hypothetical protein
MRASRLRHFPVVDVRAFAAVLVTDGRRIVESLSANAEKPRDPTPPTGSAGTRWPSPADAAS